MFHQRPVALLPATLAACAALFSACSSTGPDAASTVTTESPTGASTSAAPDEPIDLAQVAEDTPLEPGTYLVPFLHDDGPMRAVVDLPGGYRGGGPVFGTDIGDVAVWGRVTRVATDACLGGSRRVGPTVRGLATALSHQGHMRHSRPVQVSIDGYRGLYVKTAAPANLHACRGRSVLIYTAGGTWLQSDVPGTIFRAWILDVDGRRLVAGTRSFTDTADSDPINRIWESARFTSVDR